MARMVRKQIYIGQENNKLLKQRAKELGITESELIRRGIEQMEYSYNGFSMDKKSFIFENDLEFVKKKQSSSKNLKKNEKSNLLLAKYLSVGYYLIAPLLLGVFFGSVVDSFLKTKPYFTFTFLIFGIVSAFYNLYKLTKEKF